MRCDLLLQTDKVSKNGIAEKVHLALAIQQKDIYQFASIFNKQPTFTWEMDTAVKAVTAYRILVATTPQYLNENKVDFWDSKKTNSNKTAAVYKGKPLETGKIYYWKVQIWSDKNGASPFSETASFYLNAPDTAEVFAHHPLSSEVQNPMEIVKKANNSYFLDFGKDALGQLQLHLTSEKSDSIWIEVGEALADKSTIAKDAGRNIQNWLFLLSV